MQSIIQSEKRCAECGTRVNLHNHHCLHGTANRKQADRFGLTVWLCEKDHRELHDRNREMDLKYIRLAQERFEKIHGTREQFMQIFGKNYL